MVYVIGGAVMWLRFRQARLPADQAVALLPKTDLLVAGLRVMILPALASAVFLVVLAHLQNARFDRLERERGRARDRLGSLPGDSDERPKVETRLDRLAEREHRLLPQRASRRRRVAVGASAVIALVFALILPFSPGAFVWPVVLLAIVVYWQRLWTSSREEGESRPKPSLLRIAAVAVIASVLVSIARQVDPMTQLPSVAVYLSPGRDGSAVDLPAALASGQSGGVVHGVLVTATDDIVAVGDPRARSISTYPRAHVAAMSVLPPLVPHTPPPSLISQLLFHDAWAWTPLKVWCEGDAYGWTRLHSVCQARPRVAADALKVVDGYVRGVRLTCPTDAATACRGFVILRTRAVRYDPRSGTARPDVLSQQRFNVLAGQSTRLPLRFDRATWEATLLRGETAANAHVRVLLARDALGEQIMFDDAADGVDRTLAITRTPPTRRAAKKKAKDEKKAKDDKKKTAASDGSSDRSSPTGPSHRRSSGGSANQNPQRGGKPDDDPQNEPSPPPETTPTPEPNPLVPPPTDDETTTPPSPTPTS